MRSVRLLTVFFALSAPAALFGAASCGSRTGLDVPGAPIAVTPGDDAGQDVFVPGPDVTPPPLPDVFIPDVIPPIDGKPLRDANPACADASDTLIYVVTQGNLILRFDPSSSTFSTIGTLSCPDPRNPFSMAVDRKGVAYVLYGTFAGAGSTPGNIFRVSLDTAKCTPTAFVPGQLGFYSFGMGFSADTVGTGETLYVASDESPSGRLGAIDPATLSLTSVGTFVPAVQGAELTGTGDGRLFAFYAPAGNNTTGSAIAQIDKTTAVVIGQANLPSVTQGSGWAFAFWGGSFYLFTAPGGTSIVQKFDPATQLPPVQVAQYPDIIVGAGVSTCAPVE